MEGTDTVATIIERLLRAREAIAPLVAQGLEEVGQKAVQQLHDASPYDPTENIGVIPGEEEHLNESFSVDTAQVTDTGAEVPIKTSEPIKFQYVTQGTDGPIYPVEAQALAIPGGHPVASVAGQDANPFQEEVAASLQNENPFGPVIEMLQSELG